MKRSINWSRLVMVSALTLVMCTCAYADPYVFNLFNTGVNSTGVALGNHVADPHYTLDTVPSGSSKVVARTSAGGFPIGPWLPNNSVSAWIAPDNPRDSGGYGSDPVGDYVYRTSFWVSDASQAYLTGQWSSDNNGVEIRLNNNLIQGSLANTGAFTTWHAFAVGTGTGFFNSNASNVLTFRVNNLFANGDPTGNPTGLRVEFTNPIGVPEGAESLCLVLMSGAVLLFALRRKHALRLE